MSSGRRPRRTGRSPRPSCRAGPSSGLPLFRDSGRAYRTVPEADAPLQPDADPFQPVGLVDGEEMLTNRGVDLIGERGELALAGVGVGGGCGRLGLAGQA